jgi:hypothetical protein
MKKQIARWDAVPGLVGELQPYIGVAGALAVVSGVTARKVMGPWRYPTVLYQTVAGGDIVEEVGRVMRRAGFGHWVSEGVGNWRQLSTSLCGKPHQLILTSDVGEMLRHWNVDWILRSVWKDDWCAWRSAESVRHESVLVHAPAVSLLAVGGALGRLEGLVICSVDRRAEAVPEELIGKVRELPHESYRPLAGGRESLRPEEPVKVGWTKEAMEGFTRFVVREDEGTIGRNALRVATCVAVGDGRVEIVAKDVGWAIDWVRGTQGVDVEKGWEVIKGIVGPRLAEARE